MSKQETDGSKLSVEEKLDILNHNLNDLRQSYKRQEIAIKAAIAMVVYLAKHLEVEEDVLDKMSDRAVMTAVEEAVKNGSLEGMIVEVTTHRPKRKDEGDKKSTSSVQVGGPEEFLDFLKNALGEM